MYRCNLCFGFVALTMNLLLYHIGKIHRNEPNFHVLCGIDGCAKTYKNFLSFRNHLIRKHKITKDIVSDNGDNANESSLVNREEDQGLYHQLVENEQLDLQTETDIDETRRANALCLLGFKERGRVPQTVVDSFVNSSTEIVRNSMRILKSGLMNRLDSAGLDFSMVPCLKELFDETNLAMNPFSGIHKEPLQYRYYKENFHLVEPQSIILGRYHKKARRGHKLINIQKTDEAYYIPLLESLQQLLNDDSILEEVENPHGRNDDLLFDFCDGDMFREHPMFATDPHALQIILYFDELEVCNPLGSRATKHKFGAFYYTLGNIKPENRSHSNAIQLLGLIPTKHIKKYGIDPILEALISDLHLLERDDGYELSIGGETRSFRGTIAYCSGDNLGSQLLGGFKQGSQAHRKCRVCMGDSEALQIHFHEDDFALRTKESHNVQCQRLDLGEHFKKTYGLNQNSVLNNSRYFHVIGGLPADAMHDVLEGVLQYSVKELLKFFINEQKIFTLEELNKRILGYDYGYHNDSNRPSQIQHKKLTSKDNNLRQHANQMWCLGLHLPLLIGNLVPEDDEHWKLFCILLQIVRIVFAPIMNKDQIPYLQVLIQEHHEKFKELYPQCSIIPKMHYMIHMPRTILQLGPLVRSWCMRFEAKHHYFKRLAISIGNYTNLPYSLSKRHQEGLCYRLQTSEGGLSSFIQKGIETGTGSTFCIADVEYEVLIQAETGGIDQQLPLTEVKWISILGTKYALKAIVHIGYDNNEFPKFWEIKKICIVNRNIENIMFLVSEKDTIEFNEHFQCFEVLSPARPIHKIVYARNFTSYIPMNILMPVGVRTKCVCLRFDIDTN